MENLLFDIEEIKENFDIELSSNSYFGFLSMANDYINNKELDSIEEA